jgi:hypothetical protein
MSSTGKFGLELNDGTIRIELAFPTSLASTSARREDARRALSGLLLFRLGVLRNSAAATAGSLLPNGESVFSPDAI